MSDKQKKEKMASDLAFAIIQEAGKRTAVEACLSHLLAQRFSPWDRLELRVSSSSSDHFAVAQRAVDAFFRTHLLYPTSLAVHPAILHLFEAEERRLQAHYPRPEVLPALMGEDFQIRPIRIESDEQLDLQTVAVRFAFDPDEEAFTEAVFRSIGRIFNGG